MVADLQLFNSRPLPASAWAWTLQTTRYTLRRNTVSIMKDLIFEEKKLACNSAILIRTQLIYNHFIIKGLELDPVTIPLVDIHRLPQQPVVSGGVNIARPIIIKLNNAMDKHKIMSKLSNLKAYNFARQNEQQSAKTPRWSPKSVYATEHHSKNFRNRGRDFCPGSKKQKNQGKKLKVGSY